MLPCDPVPMFVSGDVFGSFLAPNAIVALPLVARSADIILF
jgi:hypothetical protein